MPSILCLCNQKISYSEIPSKYEWLFMSDIEFDNFTGNVDAEEVYSKMKHFLRCSSCHRLYIFWKGFNNPPEIYETKKTL